MNSGSPPELLVVEDGDAGRHALNQALSSAGFRVHEAPSGQKALDMAASLQPELIVLETRLPDIDGQEVCRILKEDPATRYIPVLQVSADVIRPEDRARGPDGGADGYLTQPFERPVLLATVRALLRARQAEEALRAAERGRERQEQQLARLQAELEEIASSISHDLRSPLVSIGGCVQLLLEGAEDKFSEESLELLTYTRDSVQHMGAMIKGLLAFARTGVGGLQPVECDANYVLGAAMRLLKDRVDQTGAQVTHDPLPTVQADEGLLRQAFQGLLENGIKFHGDSPPRVHVSARQEPEEWVFSIRDNGIGIDPAHFQKVFRLFQRLYPDNPDYDGAGIGLTICKKIVERHGGRIWLESQPGQGTTVHLTLPK